MIVRRHCALLSVVAALSPVHDLAAYSFEQQTRDTIVIVAGPPVHRGVGTLVSEMQVGAGQDSAPEYRFTSVTDVRVLENGSLAVLYRSQQSGGVRIYDSTGKYLRTLGPVGGRGSMNPSPPRDIAVTNDGRILVFDPAAGGIVAYHRDSAGRFLARIGLPGLGMGMDQITTTRGGTLYVRTSRRPPAREQEPIPFLVRHRADGAVIDTISHPDLPVVAPPMMRASRGSGPSLVGIGNRLPYAAEMVVTFSPLGYFVTSNTSRYSIDLLVPISWHPLASPPPSWKPGDRVFSIRRENVARIEVSEAERESRRQSLTDSFRRIDSAWTWTGPDIPRVKPFITDISFGIDGRIWAQIPTPSDSLPNQPIVQITIPMPGAPPGGSAPTAQTVGTRTGWRERVEYDVFEPDGKYIGHVRVPQNVTIYARNGDYVWGIQRAAEAGGRVTVHRFRIVWQ